jgi:phosphatidylserine decarboxylase
MSKKSDETIVYYDRQQKKLCEEIVMGEGAIRWAYQTISGMILSRFIFGNALLSRLLGWYFDSSLSRDQIMKTIIDLQIDENEFLETSGSFKSFNSFFTRKLKTDARPFATDHKIIVSPADGRVLVYPNATKNSLVDIKGMKDTVSNFVGQTPLGKEFDECSVIVVRLCPADYHRYHFPCDGIIKQHGACAGAYHSVNPFALAAKTNIFCQNKREYTICTSAHGDFIMAEVGAFGVAGIIQTYTNDRFSKMDEKGYFKFGGSTVILVFPKGMVKFSDDLIEQSASGYETLLHVGAEIGTFE